MIKYIRLQEVAENILVFNVRYVRFIRNDSSGPSENIGLERPSSCHLPWGILRKMVEPRIVSLLVVLIIAEIRTSIAPNNVHVHVYIYI